MALAAGQRSEGAADIQNAAGEMARQAEQLNDLVTQFKVG